MEILFCDRCHESIPDADVESGKAVRVNGRVLHLPVYRARLAELGLEPFELSPPEASAFIARELDKWTNLVAAANIVVE